MKAIHSMIAALGLAFVLPASANAAQSDPEVIIYRFPGLHDAGTGGQGVATSFLCTNFSGVTESIRFVTRNSDGTLLTNHSFSIGHLATLAVSSHATVAFGGSVLGTGFVAQGTTAIAATSINIICTAMILDAGAFLPTGVALRGIRFNPVPGSQE
jgi:hypothetical protein